METHRTIPTPIENISLDRLGSIIAARVSEMRAGLLQAEESYTVRLIQKGVDQCAKKVGEEAVEVVLEAVKRDKQKFIEEMAQLFYHQLVLMRMMGVSMADIEWQLGLVHSQMSGSDKSDMRGT